MPKHDRPEGFTEEVGVKLKQALENAKHRQEASMRYFARGARLSSMAKRKSEAGELERDSPEGEKIVAELEFYKGEVIGEAFMALGTIMICGVCAGWLETHEPPDSLAECLLRFASELEPPPFAEPEGMAMTLTQIALLTIEQTAQILGHDSTSCDAGMPAVLAEAAVQLSCALTGQAEEPDDEDMPSPQASIQPLKMEPGKPMEEITVEELREIYNRQGELPQKPKKKKKSE